MKGKCNLKKKIGNDNELLNARTSIKIHAQNCPTFFLNVVELLNN